MDYNQENTIGKLKFFRGYRIPEFIELSFYLFVAFIFIYFVAVKLNKWLFLIVLPIVWFSKKDYLWIAFFFILMEMPGGLFSGGLRDDPSRLPIYSLAPGVSFAINELFILVILVKSLVVKRIARNYSPPLFQKELKLLLWLFLGLILVSPLLGMSMESMSNVFKLALSLSLFYSLFHLINNEEQLIKFLKVMFPFAFVALALQIYGLINGEQLIALVKPGVSAVQGSYNISGKQGTWIRPIEMGHAMLITFTGSLFLLMSKRHNLSKQYLILINLISFLVILMSGTRSWFVAFCLGYLVFFFLAGERTPKLIINSIVVILILLLMIRGISVINDQVKNALSRIATVEKVMGGDITGGGTISRYDVRAPKVMEGFLSSSVILGAGFSDLFYKYSDGHVGYHNMLLNSGIVGFMLFLYVIWKVLRFPFIFSRKFNKQNKPLLKTSIISLIILLVINTGTQTIGFTPEGVNRVVLMVYSLLIINIAVKITVNGSLQQESLFKR
ncbi:MAG: hypothetical protein MUO72_14475 [Bacteroidales bacterium]|nr:hypothetical protein [Bacteroidales bacterium]